MPLVLTTSPTFATVGGLATAMEREGYTLARHTEIGDAYHETLAEAEYLVAGLPAVTAETLKKAPRLKGIHKHGVGLDSIDIDAATAAGIPVTSTPAANAQAVAEMALGAIIALSRNLLFGHRTVSSGEWTRLRGREVSGATLGIIGFGQIGQRLARMARGIGMTILAFDPYPATSTALELGVELTTLDDVLARSDAVSLHLAASPGTANLIDTDTLAKMKPGAMLLNFARGSLVDLDALAVALHSGHIAGAAIDAYPVEPPDISHAIFSAPCVLFSPHSGGDTAEAIRRMSEMVFEDISKIATGRMPARTINADALLGM